MGSPSAYKQGSSSVESAADATREDELLQPTEPADPGLNRTAPIQAPHKAKTPKAEAERRSKPTSWMYVFRSISICGPSEIDR
jgi:hypothetical protein